MASHGEMVPMRAPSRGRMTRTSVCGTKRAPERRTGSSRRGTSCSSAAAEEVAVSERAGRRFDGHDLSGGCIADEEVVDRDPCRPGRSNPRRALPAQLSRVSIVATTTSPSRSRTGSATMSPATSAAPSTVQGAPPAGEWAQGPRPAHVARERVERRGAGPRSSIRPRARRARRFGASVASGSGVDRGRARPRHRLGRRAP